MIIKLRARLLLAAMPFAAHAQHEPNYTITGNVKNVNMRHVYLVYYGSKGFVRDSAQVTNGHYTLTGYAEKDMVASLTTAAPDEQLTIDNTVSMYLYPTEHFVVTHTNSFTGITVTGSTANEEYQKLLQAQREFKGDESDQPERIYGDYIRQNPSSPLALYAFENFAQRAGTNTVEQASKVLALIDLMPAHATRLQSLKQKLEGMINASEKIGIGKVAPDFTQPDTLGRSVTLSSFRGKYVLIDFWASWCGPCRKENPNVVKAYEKYHPKGFEILGISLDENDQAWKKAIIKDKLNWVHLSDLKYWNNSVALLYGVSGIPQNYLIDPQGKIIATALRGEALDKKLAEIYP